MKIYELLAKPDNYDPLVLPRYEDYTIDDTLDGTPRLQNWTALKMRYYSEFEGKDLPKGDFPAFSLVPIFPPHTVKALSDLIEGMGELLPINVSGRPFYMFNVTKVLDCLDHDKSEINSFYEGGVKRIISIDKYIFHEECIGQVPIFKIPESLEGYVFVTQVFVDRVNEIGLKGFRFLLHYDSDN